MYQYFVGYDTLERKTKAVYRTMSNARKRAISCQFGSSADSTCPDLNDRCQEWAGNGECILNPTWMLFNCKQSCEVCTAIGEPQKEKREIMNSGR